MLHVPCRRANEILKFLDMSSFCAKKIDILQKKIDIFIYFLRKRLIFLDVIGNTKNSYKMQRLISKKIDIFL